MCPLREVSETKNSLSLLQRFKETHFWASDTSFEIHIIELEDRCFLSHRGTLVSVDRDDINIIQDRSSGWLTS